MTAAPARRVLPCYRDDLVEIYNADSADLGFLPDRSVQLVVTSPPYNLGKEYGAARDNATYFSYLDWAKGWCRELYRVLEPGGRLCLAIVHPINSAGRFEDPDGEAPFVIRDSYFDPRIRTDVVEREGLPMTFRGWHRPLEAWFASLERAGLVVELLTEVPDTTLPPGARWRRIPLFLHMRARRA